MSDRITLLRGDFGWTYVLEHDDRRDLVIQSDWEYPSIAMAFGWSPCCRCSRSCRGATDGTIDCARRKASEHIAQAQKWLDSHIGKRVVDPGYFEDITYPMSPDLIRAIYHMAYEYHSGQNSRGYRLLCRVQRYARKHGIDLDRETREYRRLHFALASQYGNQL